jgi:TPR repeat protein
MEQQTNNMKRKISFSIILLNEIYGLFFRAYKLFKQAAGVGHIGAKEELALGHLLGVHLSVDLNRATAYFQQGVENGSPQSHYVNFDISL